MVVPNAAAAAVPPHGEDLPDHHHTAQCTVGELQDLRVADFLQGEKTCVMSGLGVFNNNQRNSK